MRSETNDDRAPWSPEYRTRKWKNARQRTTCGSDIERPGQLVRWVSRPHSLPQAVIGQKEK